MEAATSAGTARAEAPGLSKAREKAGAVPAKSVRLNGNQRYIKKRVLEHTVQVTRFYLIGDFSDLVLKLKHIQYVLSR